MAILRGGVVLTSEVATGTIDGINKTFTTSFPFVPGTIIVFLNGLEQVAPDDYVEIDDQTIEFVNAPISGTSPDLITFLFQRAE